MPSPPAKEETGVLLMRAAERDSEAYALLFARYAPRICGYVFKRGLDRPTAEEVTQEIMLTLWQKARHFDPAKGAARAWIFRVTRNKLIDRKRRIAVRPQTGPLDEEIGGNDVTTPPSERRHDAEHFANWANANLDAAQTETLRLAYVEGLSSAEIARTMNVPQGTVKSRLRLALAALRQAAAEER